MVYICFNLIGNIRNYCILPVRRFGFFFREEELYPSLPLGFRCFLMFLFFYLLHKCRTFFYLHNREMRNSSITMQSISLFPFFGISKELAFYRKIIFLYSCIAFCHQRKASSLSSAIISFLLLDLTISKSLGIDPVLSIPLILWLWLVFASKKLL